jgi:hypothetical protein
MSIHPEDNPDTRSGRCAGQCAPSMVPVSSNGSTRQRCTQGSTSTRFGRVLTRRLRRCRRGCKTSRDSHRYRSKAIWRRSWASYGWWGDASLPSLLPYGSPSAVESDGDGRVWHRAKKMCIGVPVHTCGGDAEGEADAETEAATADSLGATADLRGDGCVPGWAMQEIGPLQSMATSRNGGTPRAVRALRTVAVARPRRLARSQSAIVPRRCVWLAQSIAGRGQKGGMPRALRAAQTAADVQQPIRVAATASVMVPRKWVYWSQSMRRLRVRMVDGGAASC